MNFEGWSITHKHTQKKKRKKKNPGIWFWPSKSKFGELDPLWENSM